MIRLNIVAGKMADEIYTIRKSMEGKGISPVQAPIINAKMTRIEIKLRNLGANLDNPVPFNTGD
jgi:hypothetical protein